MIETAKRDPNYVTTLMGVDMTTGLIPTNVYVDETTHRLLVSAIITGGGGGSSYSKPTDEYDLVQDDDTSSTSYEYYGFMKADGAWYIKRITLSDNLREYIKGTSGYTAEWANRALQTYADYGTTFN